MGESTQITSLGIVFNSKNSISIDEGMPSLYIHIKNYRDRHGISIHLRYKFNQVNSKYKGGMLSSEIRRLVR